MPVHTDLEIIIQVVRLYIQVQALTTGLLCRIMTYGDEKHE